jgi:hypothetical protein
MPRAFPVGFDFRSEKTNRSTKASSICCNYSGSTPSRKEAKPQRKNRVGLASSRRPLARQRSRAFALKFHAAQVLISTWAYLTGEISSKYAQGVRC